MPIVERYFLATPDNTELKKTVKYIKPQPGGQTVYLARPEFEVLYGGSAGPGKSWGIVQDAMGLRYRTQELGKAAIEVPEYRAALFRRKTTQFGNLIDEAKKYYIPIGAEFVYGRRGDPGPSFNFYGRDLISGVGYTGKRNGARIFVCHMEQESNKEDHHGLEYQFVGFDELTQFTLTQYLYLFSRCRSTIPGLHARIRSTSNPVGSGLLWVKKRFIKSETLHLQPYKTYFFRAAENPEDNPQGIRTHIFDRYAKSRCFVPGFLKENRILMDNDPAYEMNIRQMGEQYTEALLEGSWDAFGGTFFKDFSAKLLKKEEFYKITPDVPIVGSLDPGWTMPCSFGLWAVYPNKFVRLFTYYMRHKSPLENAKAIKKMIKDFPYTEGRMPNRTISGKDAFIKREKGRPIAADRSFDAQFRKLGITLLPANTDRILGWMIVKQLMKHKQLEIWEPFNLPLLNEISAAEPDDKNPEDILGGGNDVSVPDHALDEFRYFCMTAPFTKEIKLNQNQLYMEMLMDQIEEAKDYTVMGA